MVRCIYGIAWLTLHKNGHIGCHLYSVEDGAENVGSV